MKFHLDETRVQNLLMGEQLYGDRSLAVRELYQNAVDACRHLDARRAYLGLEPLPAAEPRVQFVEGVDQSGRGYLDCIDTGVGMGVIELEHAFGRAGIRSTDRPEFVAEQNDCARADPPVSLWTNSRFGVGALSYFMLADRVEITTTLFGRDGSLGPTLRVVITGPEAEFDVTEEVQATAPGTTVRLWFTPGVSVSAVSTLRDWVIICPFAMTAADLTGLHHEWSADMINLSSSKMQLDAGTPPIRDEATGVWWFDGWGPVLADGIWAESYLFGNIVDLTGELMPSLTIDRKRILTFDEPALDALTIRAIPTAMTSAWHFVGTAKWLDSAFPYNPTMVDALVEAASGHPELAIAGSQAVLPVTMAGHLVGDGQFDRAFDRERSEAWSLSRALAAGAYPELNIDTSPWPPVLSARPTDSIFLATVASTVWGFTAQSVSPWSADALAIYDVERHLRWPLSRIAERARQLGLPIVSGVETLPEPTEFVRELFQMVSRFERGRPRCFEAFEIVEVATERGLSLADANEALVSRKLATDKAWPGLVDSPPNAAELIAASVQLNGVAPWRSMRSTVALPALVTAAAATNQTLGEVAVGLRRLGFSVDLQPAHESLVFDTTDLLLASRDLDGVVPFLEAGRVISAKRLKRSVRATGVADEEVLARFVRLGYRPGVHAPSGDRMIGSAKRAAIRRLEQHLGVSDAEHSTVDHWPLTVRDARVAAIDSSLDRFRDCQGELGALDVWQAAQRNQLSPKQARARLSSLGYHIVQGDVNVKRLRYVDRRLLTRGEGSGSPFRHRGDSITLVEVVKVATETNLPVAKLLGRLERLQVTLTDTESELPVLRPGPEG